MTGFISSISGTAESNGERKAISLLQIYEITDSMRGLRQGSEYPGGSQGMLFFKGEILRRSAEERENLLLNKKEERFAAGRMKAVDPALNRLLDGRIPEKLDLTLEKAFIKAFGVSDINNLKEYNALELGNNFELGTKYSDSMQLYYIDKNGVNKPYYMGCYGIGIGRIIACILENNLIKENDKIKGFAIPYNIAPYKVQIIYTENNKESANKLYELLLANNIPVIIDDRENLTIGNKITDTFVIGTPKLIIIGNKFDGINYELEDIKTNEKITLNLDNLILTLKDDN